jgi:hypothetical protein
VPGGHRPAGPEHGRTPEAEAEYLLVHGCCTCSGFDHAEPDEKAEMFALKDTILARGPASARPPRQASPMTSAQWASWPSRWSWSSSPGSSPRPRPACRRSPSPGPTGWWRRRCRARRRPQIADDPPRYLNTALLLRTIFEISAIVLVALVVFGISASTSQRVLVTAGSMIVVSYIFWGVAPRTLGRQHANRIACAAAGPLVAVTRVLGPIPRLLIMIGNALTPGRGFTDGPFATEAELREMVDFAEASAVIESGERKMIHSVFDLGTPSCARSWCPAPTWSSSRSTRRCGRRSRCRCARASAGSR